MHKSKSFDIFKLNNLKYCQFHNQPILFFETTFDGTGLCQICIQKKLGNVICVDELDQNKQDQFNNLNNEINDNIKIFQELIDNLNKFKQSISSNVDKIIITLQLQVKEAEDFKEQLFQMFSQDSISNQIETEIQKKNTINEQQKNQIKQLLLDLQENIKLDNILQKLSQFHQLQNSLNSNDVQPQPIIQQQSIIQQQPIVQKEIKNTQQIYKKFKYELIKSQTTQIKGICWSFAFNQDLNNLFIGCNNEIIIFQFENGVIKQELQRLKGHKGYVNCILIMKKQKCLISASTDSSIIIWNQNEQQNWKIQQQLQDHSKQVSCIILNKNEDNLISGSQDFTIKIWIQQKENQWICQQSIETKFYVLSLSLNDSENKLIVCGYENKILVIEKKNDQKWQIAQSIDVVQEGLRLQFIKDDLFVFQPENLAVLEVYSFDQKENKFLKIHQLKINKCSECHILFPIQFIKQKGILLVKHGSQVNLYSFKNQNIINLEQQIKFKQSLIFGKLSDDGDYLVTFQDGFVEMRKVQFQE